MTTQIQYIDRDEAVKRMREDTERPQKIAELEQSISETAKEEKNLDTEIALLQKLLSESLDALKVSEQNLEVLEQALAGLKEKSR